MRPTELLRAALALFVAGALSCARPPQTPKASTLDLASEYAKAARVEQEGKTEQAIDAHLVLLDRAFGASLPDATPAALAAIDALALRETAGMDKAAVQHALAFRRTGGIQAVLDRFEHAYASAGGPGVVRSFLARGASALARYRGDAVLAERWRAREGCARSATIVGPLDWPPVTAVERPTPLEAPSAKIAASYPGIPPFGAEASPVVVRADGCDLPLYTTSSLEGLRAVVVDFDVPRPQTIALGLASTQAAVLVAGGKIALRRGYDLGGGLVQTWANAEVTGGRLRVVVRVGTNGEEPHLAVNALAEDGTPLAAHAPLPGEAATAAALRIHPLAIAGEKRADDEVAVSTAALLALGDARTAEHFIEERANGANPPPLLALAYARAIDAAEDLPDSRATERARAAYEAASAGWPLSWEALLGHTRLAARRRGAGEGRVEALREISESAALEGRTDPMVHAFAAALAADGQLYDVAERELARVQREAPGSPLAAALDPVVHDRIGREWESYACSAPDLGRDSLACFDAKVASGDRRAALLELDRLRALRGAPDALRPLELSQYVALGDRTKALAVYDAMRPAQRPLGALGLGLSSGEGRSDWERRLVRDRLAAADVPGALTNLSTALGESPATDLEQEASRLVEANRRSDVLRTAATAILRHTERYELDRQGVLRYTIFDLRKVSGTTDVDQGIQPVGALIEGRDGRRVLRRRIYKPDGRVLEPDPVTAAAQEHAELSQLEKGDYVGQIVDGWSLPGASGQIVVDTPDLMPERTGIAEATIELRRPAALPLAVWSHALLGKPVETLEGTTKVTRWRVRNAPPRRIEDGVPRMDREVAVSFGTTTWGTVGRAIAEAIAVLDEQDPSVGRWARKAAAGQETATPEPSGDRAKVERLALEIGKTVKVASGAVLSDSAAALSGGPQTTSARTILELGQGSRSWLAYRCLRELGIPAEIVVAEREPFSADPGFPAHFGRFEYPLVVAHTTEGDVWLDLDVQGPPLPAGRVSPELRGRLAMTPRGAIVPVGGSHPAEDRDEVDLHLSVNERGDASGTFAVLLRGRTAQMIAEALEKVVGMDRRDLLRNVVLGWVPWANVGDVALSSSEGSWQVSVRADIEIPGYAQPERAGWVLPGLEPLHSMFPRSAVGTLGGTFASQGERESALAIETAFQYHVHRSVELGEKARLARALPSVDVKNELLRASRTGKLERGHLEEDFFLSIPTGMLDVLRYRDFASQAHRVDDGFQTAARVLR